VEVEFHRIEWARLKSRRGTMQPHGRRLFREEEAGKERQFSEEAWTYERMKSIAQVMDGRRLMDPTTSRSETSEELRRGITEYSRESGAHNTLPGNEPHERQSSRR